MDKDHARQHGREPPEQRRFELPHERAPDQADERVAPMPLEGEQPRRAVGGAFLRRPADADAEQVGDDEARVPEHQQRRVQRGKNGFADDAGRGARQAAEGAAARPVIREVNRARAIWAA